MKIIERKSYLKSLQNVRLTPDIKVVTGVRRAGKSELIRTYMGWLKKHDKKANIIFVDYTLLSAEPLQEYHA
jgi:predicted AAA+ superfamily ATPase